MKSASQYASWTVGLLAAVLLGHCNPTSAKSYYVSAHGSDLLSGTSIVSAWKSIDRGDQLGVLVPGDTVFVLPGLHTATVSAQFKISGTAIAPIVYTASVPLATIINVANRAIVLFRVDANHLHFVGMEVRNVGKDVFEITGDSCSVSDFYLKSTGDRGFFVKGSGVVLDHNIIDGVGSNGIQNEDSGDNNRFYHNTIYQAGRNGIELKNKVVGARIFNNIVVAATDFAIKAPSQTVCAFNNVWDNGQGNYDGCVDSAGGISVDPLFVNLDIRNFNLAPGSPSIDAGAFLGYAYFGAAPDQGALESPAAANRAPILLPIGNKTVAQGQKLVFSVTASDPDATIPNLFAENIPTNASFLSLGGGLGSFEFSPDYSQLGVYNVRFIASDGGLADSELVAITVTRAIVTAVEVTPTEVTVEEGGTVQFSVTGLDITSTGFVNLNDSVTWSTTDPTGSVTASGLYTAGSILSPPDYFVKAGYRGVFFDSARVTVVSSGVIATVRVETVDGRSFPDTTLTTDNDTTVVICRAYDSGGSPLGAASASWELIGNANVGSISPSSGAGTTLTLVQPGVVRVAARHVTTAADTSGFITCTAGRPASMVVSPAQAMVSADSAKQFSAAFFDADKNATTSATVTTWSLTGSGSISGSGLFTPMLVDTLAVIGRNGSIADTASPVIVTPGVLRSLRVSPDSAEIDLGGEVTFVAEGFDSKGNLCPAGTLAWSVIGGAGSIDAAGLFKASAQGSARIVARNSSSGVSDTNRIVIVTPRRLKHLVVTPDTVAINVGSTVNCLAAGYDAEFAPIDPGVLNWSVIGEIGSISPDGVFTGTARGVARIVATNSSLGVSDTTRMYIVDVPTITTIPLGNSFDLPGSDGAPLLAFGIANSFDSPVTLTGLRVRSRLKGAASSTQIAAAVESLVLYNDLDRDGFPEISDQLLGTVGFTTAASLFNFGAVGIPRGESRTFLVVPKLSLDGRDGDSIDLFLGIDDVITAEGITLAGPDTVNSLGYSIINGLASGQATIVKSGNADITFGSGRTRALTIDIPRNGYKSDVLKALSVVNSGTADEEDIDSLWLYRDNGDNIWNGAASEILAGALVFTGEEWSVSGLTESLSQRYTRYHLAVSASVSARHGATIAFAVPLKGIEMASNNDGPINTTISSRDTLTIKTSQVVSVYAAELPAQTLAPGAVSGPVLGVEFVSSLNEAVSINGLRLTSYGTDPDGATQQQLDSQIDSLRLFLDGDDDWAQKTDADRWLASGVISGGSATLSTGGVVLQPGNGRARFYVEVVLNAANAKNGNTVRIGLADASAVIFANPQTVAGEFPLANDAPFTINSFTAAQVKINELASRTLYAGQTQTLLLDLEIPRNGYAVDRLVSFSLRVVGSVTTNAAISKIQLWRDTGAAGFAVSDKLVATLQPSLSSWSVSGIAEDLTQPSTRFFLTVDIRRDNIDGGVLQLEVPVGGIRYQSTLTGPDDRAVANAETHLILPSNRITVFSLLPNGAEILPGSNDNTLAGFALYNGYVNAQHKLTGIRLTNTSSRLLSAAYSDHELGQVSLFHDLNRNHVLEETSPVATGFFANGILTFTGLNLTIPSDSVEYFQIRTNVPLDLIDAEVLGVTIMSEADLTFESFVSIGGDLPLGSASPLTVNGSTVNQYTAYRCPAVSISPGDSRVSLFAFRPAFNGDLVDTLNSIEIGNLLDADTSDIALLELWRDTDGDVRWSETDQLLGPIQFANGTWLISELDLPVVRSSDALLVTANFYTSARSERKIQLQIPPDGCQFASGNDGPIDGALVGPDQFQISDARLRLVHLFERNTYSEGEEITLRLRAINALSTPLSGVTANLVNVTNAGIVSLISSSTGPLSIPGGGAAEFEYRYLAIGTGTVEWQFRARTGSNGDSSAAIGTGPYHIQPRPPAVVVNLVSSMPTAVTRGQMFVYPFSLEYQQSGDNENSAPAKLDSLILKVEDGHGQARIAGELFDRLLVTSGISSLAAVENVPNDSFIILRLPNSTAVSMGESRLLSLRADIDSAASGAFALSLLDGNALFFSDANSGLAVPLESGIAFPLRTPSCRVDIPARELAVAFESATRNSANRGQRDVELMKLRFRHPGVPENSPLQVGAVECLIVDGNQNAIPAATVVSELRLVDAQGQIVGDAVPLGHDNPTILISLSTAAIPFGATTVLSLRGEIDASATLGEFGVVISDSTAFLARDASSGSVVPVVRDNLALVANTTYPFFSGAIRIKQPATAPTVCLQDLRPGSVVGGSDSVALIRIELNSYPAPDQSLAATKALLVALHDTLGRSLDPFKLFDRIGYRIDDGAVTYLTTIGFSGGQMELRLAEPYPSTTNTSITLFADLDAGAPYDHFALTIQSTASIELTDANDPMASLLADWDVACDGGFPFQTTATRVMVPAAAPTISENDQSPIVAAQGQSDLRALRGAIDYAGASALGALRLGTWECRLVQRTPTESVTAEINSVLSKVRLVLDGQIVAQDTSFAENRIRLTPNGPFVISSGSIIELSLNCDLRDTAAFGNFYFEFSDPTAMIFYDQNLGVPLTPNLHNGSFPLKSAEISVGPVQFDQSFSNFPNPFSPVRDELTTIAFVLDRQAQITLELFTITGESVRRIVDKETRAAGTYQVDTWNGRNGIGELVLSGAYLCRLTAEFSDGSSATAMRKIGVVR